MSKIRVYWTHEENLAVYREMCRLAGNCIFKPSDQTMDLIRRAQANALPVGRRVNPLKRSRMMTILEGHWRDVYSQAIADINRGYLKGEDTSAKAPAPTARVETSPDTTYFTVGVPGVSKILDDSLGYKMDSIAQDLLSHRMATAQRLSAIEDHILSILDHLTQPKKGERPAGKPDDYLTRPFPYTEKVAIARETSTPRKRPKVLVMGLLPDQENSVRNEFGALLDLRFWKDGSLHLLKNQSAMADHVVVMAKFTAHDALRMVRAVTSRIMYCNGGVSALSDILQGLALLSPVAEETTQ